MELKPQKKEIDPPKKSYSEPRLVIYGDVEKITLAAGVTNADVLNGPVNTAFSPG